MVSRCVARGTRYSARGVTVCERWRQSFDAFLRDMGERPSRAHSIDRIDNDGHYEPGNCRWATAKEQANHRRTSHLVTLDGRTQTVAQWADELGLKYMTVYHRIERGWPPERALVSSMRHTRQIRWRGEERSLPQWAEALGIKYATIVFRLRKGWSVDRAFSTPTGGGQ
jgi:hypothetical protein